MIAQLRVGIPIVGGTEWFGGVSLIQLHMNAVTSLPKSERPQLWLVITDITLNKLTCYQTFLDKFDGVIYLGYNPAAIQSMINTPFIHCTSEDDLFRQIHFYFPVCFNVMPGYPAASWIPDFQHKYLPDFFSSQEIVTRDELCRHIADQSNFVFCSSHAVEKDFRRFYPASQAVTKVLALRACPEADWFNGDPGEVQKQYGLPDCFILCANQFWRHKNHRCLFEAVALLRRAGTDIHLVCTGLTYDYRSPGYFQEISQSIDELGITDLVHILGLIPRWDQIQLIRRSLFVVQPSLFEGLSLIVKECRALGKRIILSDIDIFLEYEYGTYFKRTDPRDLAQKISDLMTTSSPGPDLQHEAAAKLQAAELAMAYAREFCTFVREAVC